MLALGPSSFFGGGGGGVGGGGLTLPFLISMQISKTSPLLCQCWLSLTERMWWCFCLIVFFFFHEELSAFVFNVNVKCKKV